MTTGNFRSTPSIEAAAAKLTFIETEGGPIILMAASKMPRWLGTYDEQGDYKDDGSDYPRACAEYSLHVIDVAGS
jgi:hypothetical protein